MLLCPRTTSLRWTRMVTVKLRIRVRRHDNIKTLNFTCTGVSGHSKSGTKYMHPRDLNHLFIELRGITEEIKSFYAYHSMLLIIESIMILVSGVTTITINHLQLNAKFVHSEYFVVHCVLRLLFLFFVVRETHCTTCEASTLFAYVCMKVREYLLDTCKG